MKHLALIVVLNNQLLKLLIYLLLLVVTVILPLEVDAMNFPNKKVLSSIEKILE